MAVHLRNQISLETSYLRQDAGKIVMEFSDIQKLVNQIASVNIMEQKFTYDVIKENDMDEVISLLKRTFFLDEPLNCYVQLGECQDLEEYCKKSIPDNCSYKAVNSNGEIVGVYLNGIIRKPTEDDMKNWQGLASKTQHEKFKKIMQLMDYIDSKFNLFELYPDIDAFVDGKILAVDPKYRGQNIAGRLTELSLDFIKENNLNLFHVLCTSHYSARVCEKMGFKEVFRVPYDEYKINDVQVFCPEKPHVAARILVKEISS